MSINKLNLGIIGITSIIVFMLGIALSATMVSGNPYKDPNLGLVFIENEVKREPAQTLSNLPEDLKIKTQKQPVINLKCVFKGKKEFSVDSRQLRLLGTYCQREKEGGWEKLKMVSLKNRTNGYVATSFNLGKNKFTSDYISLDEGENNLLMTIEGESGSIQLTDLVVTRLPAAIN